MADDNIYITLPKTVNPNLELPDPLLLDYYQNKENRTIWVLDEIGEEAYDWVSQILQYNREDAHLDLKARQPIKFIIANQGGSLEAARMICEIIQLSKTPVYGIAIGVCASAASMIFVACHKRYALKNAYWVFHKGSCTGVGGNYQELESFMEDYKKQIEELANFYKKHTKFPPEEIDKQLEKGDWYIYPTIAIENGVVDEIVSDIDILL